MRWETPLENHSPPHERSRYRSGAGQSAPDPAQVIAPMKEAANEGGLPKNGTNGHGRSAHLVKVQMPICSRAAGHKEGCKAGFLELGHLGLFLLHLGLLQVCQCRHLEQNALIPDTLRKSEA